MCVCVAKIEVQDLIPDMTLNRTFLNYMTLEGWEVRVKRALQDPVKEMRHFDVLRPGGWSQLATPAFWYSYIYQLARENHE